MMSNRQSPKSRQKPPAVKPACGTCLHLHATSDDGGECRRYPPQAITHFDFDDREQRQVHRVADRFPGVRKADIWCGEWRKSA
jgi:hypothetical protein